MATDEAGGNDSSSGGGRGGPLGGILKKAVGAYVTAEETVKGTLGVVQIPKELLKEMIEQVFEAYTITVQTEIKLTPKKNQEKKT